MHAYAWTRVYILYIFIYAYIHACTRPGSSTTESGCGRKSRPPEPWRKRWDTLAVHACIVHTTLQCLIPPFPPSPLLFSIARSFDCHASLFMHAWIWCVIINCMITSLPCVYTRSHVYRIKCIHACRISSAEPGRSGERAWRSIRRPRRMHEHHACRLCSRLHVHAQICRRTQVRRMSSRLVSRSIDI